MMTITTIRLLTLTMVQRSNRMTTTTKMTLNNSNTTTSSSMAIISSNTLLLPLTRTTITTMLLTRSRSPTMRLTRTCNIRASMKSSSLQLRQVVFGPVWPHLWAGLPRNPKRAKFNKLIMLLRSKFKIPKCTSSQLWMIKTPTSMRTITWTIIKIIIIMRRRNTMMLTFRVLSRSLNKSRSSNQLIMLITVVQVSQAVY